MGRKYIAPWGGSTEREPWQCTYCVEPATARLVGSEIKCCRHCRGLYSASDWNALALRWLEQSPEDWVSDVASFLEANAPSEQSFEYTAPPQHLIPVGLVGADPSDWLTD